MTAVCLNRHALLVEVPRKAEERVEERVEFRLCVGSRARRISGSRADGTKVWAVDVQ